jgi:DNA polymerase-3 subunit delta'
MKASSLQPAAGLAPWIERQALALLQQRGHAWLLQGPSGLGQWALAMNLVRAWLCEQPRADGLACESCPGCHAIGSHTHADLYVLMPEVHMLEQGWPVDERAQKEIDDKKRKPSKEIRIEAMRAAIEFAQRTSSRNRGKAVLVYPAERMNAITANALLKTLEEPAGDTRFVLVSEAAHLLLPTVRSRCMAHTLHWPAHQEALFWLQAQGMDPTDAAVLLVAAGGRPQDALDLAAQGIRAQQWRILPHAALTEDHAAFSGFTPAQAVVVLQKICHDLLSIKAGGTPRFFAADDLPKAEAIQDWAALAKWAQALAQDARTSEHPYVAGLFLEDLLSRASKIRRMPAAARA